MLASDDLTAPDYYNIKDIIMHKTANPNNTVEANRPGATVTDGNAT